MNRSEGISVELRRKAVAASTIREALAGYITAEPEKLLRKLASAASTLDALVAIQAEAKAFVTLKRELDQAMSDGTAE